ncbi:MAG: hypothetical protein II412_08840 [Clostridia bacterium]|nr:hypothetical protein [Clostridia bacterium]
MPTQNNKRKKIRTGFIKTYGTRIEYEKHRIAAGNRNQGYMHCQLSVDRRSAGAGAGGCSSEMRFPGSSGREHERIDASVYQIQAVGKDHADPKNKATDQVSFIFSEKKAATREESGRPDLSVPADRSIENRRWMAS